MNYVSVEYIRYIAKNVKQSMRFSANKDFCEWRKEAVAKLEELLGLPLEKCESCFRIVNKSERKEYTRLDFEFQSESDYLVQSAILIPSGEKKKRPCVICLQGHSSGMHISLGESRFPGDEKILEGRDFALQAVKEGFCAVTIEQRYMGRAGQGNNGTSHCLQGLANAALLLGRTPIGERVWDVKILIDVLEREFSDFIDFDKLICLGNSGGGTTTLYAAALDERIKIAVPSCYLCTFEHSIMAMYHCPCNFVPSLYKYFDMGDIACLIAPRPIVMVSGKTDVGFHIDGALEAYETIEKIYRKAGAENNCRMVIGEEGHRFYADLSWPVFNELSGWKKVKK